MRLITALSATLALAAATAAHAAIIPVTNPSFESPYIVGQGFEGFPLIDGWSQFDAPNSLFNTGVFVNPAPGSLDPIVNLPNHIDNATGDQLAFLGSQVGNGFTQALASTFEVGKSYQLTIDVGISVRVPPSDRQRAAVALLFNNGGSPAEVAGILLDPTQFSGTTLNTVTIDVPQVLPTDPYANANILIAVLGAGEAGAFWNFDNVKLTDATPQIPEPASLGLLALGTLALLRRQRP